MERRDLLKALGAAGALVLLPREAMAAWTRVASGLRPAGGLTDAQLALVNAIGDVLLPRTDTPGAADVNVAAFVDVIVTENYNDADRATFLTNLDALNPSNIESIEAITDRRAEPQRTYWSLKGLIVHGYFTSERIQKDVLKVQVMPGYNADAPHPPGATNG